MRRIVPAAARTAPLALVLVTLIAAATAAARPPNGDFGIELKARSFTPPARAEAAQIRSARAGAAGDRVHYFVQVESLPDAPARARIAAEQGIHLLTYVTANTYIASSSVAALGRLSEVAGLRWAGPIDPQDKIAPALARGSIGEWARAGDGRVALMIQGHADVSASELEALARGLGGEVVDAVPSVPFVTAIFAPGRVNQLARADAVQYVDTVPIPLGELNDGARAATNAATVNAAPYNLTGAGVNVLVYDSGMVDTVHGDFAGRVIQLDGDATETVRNHSTHVSGTVLGDGSQSNQNDTAGNPNGGTAGQWAGMAPGASLRSFGSSGGDTLYNNAGDLNGDFTTALTAAGGTDLATMSLGNNVVLNGFPCAQLGDYTGTAIVMDQIVRGSIGGQQLIYLNAAGNERGGAATCGTTYSTIPSPATAKNTIVVGAVNSNDNTMTGFSSWGPTDDGRLKPDIVGPGCQTTGDGGITSTGFLDGGGGNLDPGETQNAYVQMCGTSMATPAAAGSTALVVQRWKALYGAAARPLGHTAKAILIHTATDLGNAGPDYQFGYGHVNAQAAVDLVNADATANLIVVDQVDNGATDSYTFNSDGLTGPQVTLVWSDPPAAQLAATALINDLDLRLIDPDGIVYQPFVLDPANPANVATTGNDATNNVEMVVGAAKAGTWQVTVAGTAVPSGPQQYTLITPEDASANRPPVADADGPYLTQEGTDVALDATGSSDPDGDPLTYEWDFDADGSFDDATGPTPTFDLVGQDGAFTVSVRVTDDDGAFDVDSSTVTVTNVAPSVTVGSDSPKEEGETLTVSGVVSDPGWLDPLTATVDWGDGSPLEAVPGVLENVRPDATLTYSAAHVYGDRGIFTVTVCGSDDDTTTCESTDVAIGNVDPTVAIDKSGATLVNGVPTIFASAGDSVPFSGNAQDPGSDDLTFTWDWDDGSTDVFVSLVNPPLADPFPSPTLQPRNVTDDREHVFGDACLYDVELTVVDDDGGSGSDGVAVIIVGNAELARSAGYWQQQYAPRPGAFSDAQLLCFLQIAGFMSTVFHEETDASTIELARQVLFVPGNSGDMIRLLDRQLLAAWLNFANGAIGLLELVDTDGDGTADTTFWAAVAAAEAVRLDPTSTPAELEEQKNILERVNLMDE